MAIQLYKNGERISGSGVTINSAGGTAADVVDTVGAETVSDGVDLITVVTRDTDQEITADKVVSGQLTSSGVTVFTTPTAGNATTTVATTAFVDRDFEKKISGTNQVAYATELSGLPTIPEPISTTNQVAYATEISGLPTLGTLSAQDDLTAAQITALGIPLPVSATNQVAYATELSGVPTTFAPSAHTHVAADITDFNDAVDTRITTIGDVVIFADATAFTADSASTTWHRGDVAILTDTNVAYLFTGTDGDTTVTLVADFHQITSTETLVSLGIMASAAELNLLSGVTALAPSNAEANVPAPLSALAFVFQQFFSTTLALNTNYGVLRSTTTDQTYTIPDGTTAGDRILAGQIRGTTTGQVIITGKLNTTAVTTWTLPADALYALNLEWTGTEWVAELTDALSTPANPGEHTSIHLTSGTDIHFGDGTLQGTAAVPVSSTNQVDYATELANVPTVFPAATALVNRRDSTLVQEWFGTQAQFDAETEITDGSVAYNIYPNP